MKTVTLAHYYTSPEVQSIADRVGDSLDLSRFALEQKADRIVFAGVKFMAETAKILNPEAQVILPDKDSTCSLVTMMPNRGLALTSYSKDIFDEDTKVVTYINSSITLKTQSDIIVTSANVEDIVTRTIEEGYNVLFTPDRNMGAYLKHTNPHWGNKFRYYEDAVCEVHEKFKVGELTGLMNSWTDYGTFLLAHPESPLAVLKKADYVGSTRGMLNWVRDFKYEFGRIIVATEEGLLYNMRNLRPKLDIQLAPVYSGCQCNTCPYMAKNTVERVLDAQKGVGFEIDYIAEESRQKALRPIEKMLEMSK